MRGNAKDAPGYFRGCPVLPPGVNHPMDLTQEQSDLRLLEAYGIPVDMPPEQCPLPGGWGAYGQQLLQQALRRLQKETP